MQERDNHRSVTDIIFPPVTLENDRLFSLQRMKRGAKVGAVVGASVYGAGLVGAMIFNPELVVNEILQDPLPIIRFGVMHVFYWGAVGAVIDAFRPTSSLTGGAVLSLTDTAKWYGHGFQASARLIGKGINYLQKH